MQVHCNGFHTKAVAIKSLYCFIVPPQACSFRPRRDTKLKKMKKSVLFILVVLLSIVSANAQIKRISATRLNAVPTTEEKKAIEKAEDVKLDVLHGSSNWYVGAGYGYATDGEHMIGLEAGRRFSDHFRLGVQGMVNLTKSIVSNHSWFVLKPSFDLIPSQSGFYKATGIDISISPLIGGKVQCKGLRKFEDSEGNTRLRDLQCIPNITYGGAAEFSWNFVKHAQLRVGVNYLTMSKEKDFIENNGAFVENLNEADKNEVLSGNWQKGQFMVTASVTVHF